MIRTSRRPGDAPRYADGVTTHVRIVGAGLIGTSLGIALSDNGFRVSLEDPSPTAVRLARDLRAGEVADDGHGRRPTSSSSPRRPTWRQEPSSTRSTGGPTPS